MFNLLEADILDKDTIVDKAKELSCKGYRLIQLHCVKTAEEMFLIYSFETSDYEFCCYRINVTDGETLPSVSSVFPHACLYENETNELFGLNITGMSIDFKGHFYTTAQPHAFSNMNSDKS